VCVNKTTVEGIHRKEASMKFQGMVNYASLTAVLALSAAACSRTNPEIAYASTSGLSTTAQSTESGKQAKGAALRLVLAPTGNAVRYRVREQLVGHDLPNDAVGETARLTGAISIDSSGNVIGDGSKFTVDAGSFVSDQE